MAPFVYYTPQGQPIPNRTLDTPDEINGINRALDSNYTERDTLYDVFNNFYEEWEIAYLHDHTRLYAEEEALEHVNAFIRNYDGFNTPLILPANYLPLHESFEYRPIPYLDLTVDNDNVAPPPPMIEDENDNVAPPPPMIEEENELPFVYTLPTYLDLTVDNDNVTPPPPMIEEENDDDSDSDMEIEPLPLDRNVIGIDDWNNYRWLPPPPMIEDENELPFVYDVTTRVPPPEVNRVGYTHPVFDYPTTPAGVNRVGYTNADTDADTDSDDEMEGAGRNHISPHTVRPFFAMN